MSVLVLALIAAAASAWWWTRGGGREDYRRSRREDLVKAAEAQRRSLARAFEGVHAYREAQAPDWAGLDRGFFRDATSAFEREGFVVLGDLVDETILGAFPNMRHVMRVVLGDGGRVRAAIMHLRLLGFARVLQLLGLLPRPLTIVECVSELDIGGRFVSTASSLGIDRLSTPDEVAAERLPPTTPVAAIVARHRERLAAHARATFQVMAGTADVLRSMQRNNVLIARYRAGVGPLTAEELVALQGRPLDDGEREFLRALRREDDPPTG